MSIYLLFDDISKVLRQKIEQIVKLIRSKGVGIYFCTQNPRDIPDEVLAQLGNKIQHALHAYTPAEERAVKTAADSFRANPEFDTKKTIMELGVGEALVSVLDEDGVPTMVERCRILPPASLMGAIDESEKESIYKADEFLERLKSQQEFAAKEAAEAAQAQKEADKQAALEAKEAEKAAKEKECAEAARKRKVKSAAGSVASSAAGTIGREFGKSIGGKVGGKFGKTLGGNLAAQLGRSIMGTFFK